MIAKSITYTDYNGVERTETFYFNLSRADLFEMELSTEGGLENMLNKMLDDKDSRRMAAFFKDLILKAYGQKSDDGRRFIKNQELSDAFYQSEAYSELFVELISDAEKANAFLTGVLPAMSPEQQKLADEEFKKKLAAHPELAGAIQ